MTSSRFDHREEEEEESTNDEATARRYVVGATTLACMQDDRVRVSPKLFLG
jgi:hypothetical protein